MNNQYQPTSLNETQFHEAFLRLVNKKPIRLPKGTSISQNNVAREAGYDPSALRKSRYPALIEAIQKYLDSCRDTESKALSPSLKNQRRLMDERCKQIQRQRDNAVSLLLEAEAKILELSVENIELRAAGVRSS